MDTLMTDSNMNEIIMTENQRFSFPRFWQLLKSDLSINKSKYLYFALAILGCFLTVAVLVSVATLNDISSHNERGMEWYAKTSIHQHIAYFHFGCLFIISVGYTILGSMTFISMKSKRERINTLMLPASMLEKFFIRFLIYFIGGSIVMTIGYAIGIAELLLTFANWNDIFYDIPHDGIQVLFITIGFPIFFGNALYSLGSSLWPRNSWVKTWVVATIANIFFTFLGIFGFFNFVGSYYEIVRHWDEDVLLWCYVVVFIVLIAVCWGLAWWRFRTTQIVQRFMKK